MLYSHYKNTMPHGFRKRKECRALKLIGESPMKYRETIPKVVTNMFEAIERGL